MIRNLRIVTFVYVALAVALVVLKKFQGGFQPGLHIGLGVPLVLLVLSLVAIVRASDRESECKTHYSVCIFSVFWCVAYLPFDTGKGPPAQLIPLVIMISISLGIPYLAYNSKAKKNLLIGASVALSVGFFFSFLMWAFSGPGPKGRGGPGVSYPEPGSPADIYCDCNRGDDGAVMLSNGKWYGKECLKQYPWKK